MRLTIAQRRIGFVVQKQSYAYLAKQSGIPKSTLWYAQKGIRALPKKYTSALRNTYQRESYGRLHVAGWSSTEARQLSWYSPESARLKESEMKMQVNKYTLGAVWQQAWKARKAGVSFDQDAAYEELKPKIIAGLQQAPQPWQSMWEVYP